MYAVVLAGGGGTRLWPLSRRARPKPFLPLLGAESLFQLTLRRIEPLIDGAATIVVSEQRHLPLVEQQAPQIPSRQRLGEPFGRNTAAAVALAAILSGRRDEDVMVVLPADHFIADEEGFRRTLGTAAQAAQDGSLVTLGIEPTGPETGYGYIVGASADEAEVGVRRVERFVEKPPRERALELLASPNGAWWNAGIFVWRHDALLAGLAKYAPQIGNDIRRGLDTGKSLTSIYEALPDISIDRALMEPASVEGKVKVVPADVGWSDLGSWDALHRALAARTRERDGVVAVGRSESVGSSNVLVHSTGDRLVVTIGLADTIVVDTPDVVLVCAADKAQEVRAIVERLTQAKETEHL
ncbi:MAG TPA: sugar phosphate nucleotidyltransferase [Candidatus Limnocylindrales bacterium]|nr:sugar phosphate nucleotidyltransferase [Candidatus Limnocylindrales bacterium]